MLPGSVRVLPIKRAGIPCAANNASVTLDAENYFTSCMSSCAATWGRLPVSDNAYVCSSILCTACGPKVRWSAPIKCENFQPSGLWPEGSGVIWNDVPAMSRLRRPVLCAYKKSNVAWHELILAFSPPLFWVSLLSSFFSSLLFTLLCVVTS